MFDEMGIEVKYDAKIEAGMDYRTGITSMIRNARALIFYVSEKSLKSLYARKELEYANQYKIPIILVYIDDVIPKDRATKKIMSGKPEIFKYDLDRKDYESAIMEHLRF